VNLVRRSGSTTIAALLIASILLPGPIAFSQSYDPDQELPVPTLFEKRIEKLGRGISNILFGWTEIPLTWDRKMKQGKSFTYLFSTAPVIGLVRAGMRTGIGVYEIFTFPVDNGERNYEPIIEPDYLF
jgi:putative exosortase-associated protein (TIGR04073 family)